MSKKNKQLIFLVGIVFVVMVGLISYAFRDQLFSEVSVQSLSDAAMIDQSSVTYRQYAAMTGETYDRNFIANMIAHHQGAVDMANLALTNAEHQELKDMSSAIIATQESEISQMLSWQREWGYPPTSGDDMIDHSAMGMMGDMASMTALLEGKSGDEFDKIFIEQMILHHQSAIDMAGPGEKNAERQEIKELTREIISAQTGEIEHMKQWQIEWGYAG